MGQVSPSSPVLLVIAAFSRHEAALAWARAGAVEAFGPVALESPVFDFRETDYYESTMGSDLKKVFFAFEELIDPARLVEIKLMTNTGEQEYVDVSEHAEPRPLNLDPGYVGLGKLVLASTKDFCHRVYLDRGIYAEVTLFYRHGRWEHHPWTFADYRREDYQAFFSRCRDDLHRQSREERPT
jgi:hypothetical protein